MRPFIFGSGAKLGLGPSPEYKFIVLVSPVSSYYKGAETGVDGWIHDRYDRAAPLGTGNVKAGGNYAADILPSVEAARKGYQVGL